MLTTTPRARARAPRQWSVMDLQKTVVLSVSVKAGCQPERRKSQAFVAMMLFSYLYLNWDSDHCLKSLQHHCFVMRAVTFI